MQVIVFANPQDYLLKKNHYKEPINLKQHEHEKPKDHKSPISQFYAYTFNLKLSAAVQWLIYAL
jgi:hypothetical protein